MRFAVVVGVATVVVVDAITVVASILAVASCPTTAKGVRSPSVLWCGAVARVERDVGGSGDAGDGRR